MSACKFSKLAVARGEGDVVLLSSRIKTECCDMFSVMVTDWSRRLWYKSETKQLLSPWSCNSWLISGEIWASPSLSVMLMKFTEISWEAGDRHRGWLTARLVLTRKGSLLFLRSTFRDVDLGAIRMLVLWKQRWLVTRGQVAFSHPGQPSVPTRNLLTAKLGEASLTH